MHITAIDILTTKPKDGEPGENGKNMGRNLLRNADFHTLNTITDDNGSTVFYINGSKDYLSIISIAYGGSDGVAVTIPTTLTTSHYIGPWFKAQITPGKTYTASAMVKASNDLTAGNVMEIVASDGVNRIDGNGTKTYHSYGVIYIKEDNRNSYSDWVKKKLTFTIPETDTAVKYIEVNFHVSGSGTLYICQPKLEEGDKPTDFCLNEEDLKATDYSIVASNLSPNVTSDAAVVTLTAYQKRGGKRTKLSLDSNIRFKIDSDYSTNNPLTLTIAKGTVGAKSVELVSNEQSEPLAVCTINPVVDGKSVTGTDVIYNVNTELPENGSADYASKEWSTLPDDFINPDNAEKYLYQCTQILYSDGKASYTTPVRVGLIGDMADVDELYSTSSVKPTDNEPKPDDWYYKSDFTPVKGQWVYTCSMITWMNGDVTYTTPVKATYIGNDGTTVKAQYSVDGESGWHTPFASGDEYMRTSENGGKTWGDAMKIVGEKGKDGPWTDYSFNISSSLTSSSATTAPSTLGLSEWQDAPIATTTDFPYLWMRIQKYSDATTKDGSARFVRVTGEQGPQGDNERVESYRISFCISADGNNHPADSDSGWQDNTAPTPTADKPYLWTRIITFYKYGEATKSYSVAKNGTGITGVDTRYIKENTTDPVQPSDAEFDDASTTFPTDIELGDFIWSRTVTSYSDGTSSKSYACNRIGDDGDAGTNVHIAYATDVSNLSSTGYVSSAGYVTGFSTSYVSGAEWIGVWLSADTADSTKATDYKWSKIKGERGPRGYEGPGEYNIFLLSVCRNDSLVAPTGAVNGGKGTWCDEPQGVSEEWPFEYVSTRKKSSGVWGSYSKPSLYANYSANANQNLLDQTGFESVDNLGKWDKKSQTFSGTADTYTDGSGNALPHVQEGGKNGHHYYGDQNAECGASSSYSKEVLEQILLDGNTEKILPDTWYTLSFWERCGGYTKFINETSKLYGFAGQKLYLYSNHEYDFRISGYVSTTAHDKGKCLRVIIYKSDWSWFKELTTDSETSEEKSMTINDVPGDGEYLLYAYLSPNDTDRSTVDYGTATFEWVRILDRTQQACVYVFPNVAVTSQVFFDGVEYNSYSNDLGTYLKGDMTNGEGTWRQHVITFKTKSSEYLAKTTSRYILFRLLPSPLDGQKTFLHVCAPKLEKGKIATEYGKSENDQKGERGPMPRGPQDWEKVDVGFNFQSGADGEDWHDIIRYKGVYYSCHNSHAKTEDNYPNSDKDNLNHYWRSGLENELAVFSVAIIDYLIGGSATFKGTVHATDGDFTGVVRATKGLYRSFRAVATSGESAGIDLFKVVDGSPVNESLPDIIYVYTIANAAEKRLCLPWPGDCEGRIIEIYGDGPHLNTVQRAETYLTAFPSKNGSLPSVGTDGSGDNTYPFEEIGGREFDGVILPPYSLTGVTASCRLYAQNLGDGKYKWSLLSAINCEFI